MPEQQQHSEQLLTRRELFSALPQAAALGGALAAAGAAAALSGCSSEKEDTTIDVLEVALNDVETLDSYSLMDDEEEHYTLTDIVTLPGGAQLFSSDGACAAVMMTGETASPLTVVKLLDLATGTTSDALNQAVGQEDGFNIIDVRGSSTLLVWVENNFLTDDWHVYAAAVSSSIETESEVVRNYYAETDPTTGDVTYGYNDETVTHEKTIYALGTPVLLDSGDADYDIPEIAVAGGLAYWIVQPSEDGTKTDEDSYLRTSNGAATAANAYTSHGRFCGGLSVSADMVCALPRVDSASSVYYQLSAFSGGSMVASQILPHSYRPNTAIYLDGSFSFGINGSYDYGDGIANVGTYYPLDDGKWLRLIREPVTPLGSCQGWLYCKSGARTVFVDAKRERYFTINPPSDSQDHGDYTVQLGAVGCLYNYATVNTLEDGESGTSVVVRRIDLESINQ